MITYKKALEILKKGKIKLKNEKILSKNASLRISAENIYSPENYPSSDNTAFDGFAVNSKDTNQIKNNNPIKFRILKTLAAGDDPSIKNVQKFSTIEVMTGAIVQKPFNSIIPIEQIQFYPNKSKPKYIIVDKKIKKNDYIRFAGSDFKKGEKILNKGDIIKPQHILALKTLGVKKISVKKLEKEFKLDFDLPVVLLIQHTVTSEIDKIDKYFLETVNAIKELNVQCLIISGNSDAGSKKISAVIKKSKIQNHSSLPFDKYINLLRNCSVLVGNSSSGIMEAPFLHKPSVNIGARQNGRLKSTSIINVDYNKNRIKRAIKKALKNKKTKNTKKQRSLYGDGNSSKKIVKLLEKIDLNKIPIQKKLTY